MNISVPLKVIEYLRPEMGNLIAKKTASQSSVAAAATADNNSEVNLTSINNYILALADKADQHHEHTVLVLLLVIGLIAVGVLYIIRRYAINYFKREVEQRVQRSAVMNA